MIIPTIEIMLSIIRLYPLIRLKETPHMRKKKLSKDKLLELLVDISEVKVNRPSEKANKNKDYPIKYISLSYSIM